MTNLSLPIDLTLANLHHHALYMTHLTGHAATWHSGVRGVFGWEESEWLGRPWESVYAPANASQAALDLQEVLTNGKAEHERQLIRRGGDCFTAELRTLLVAENVDTPVLLRIVHDKSRLDAGCLDEHEQLLLGLDVGKSIAWNWNLRTGHSRRLGALLQEVGLESGPANQFAQRVHPSDINLMRDELASAKRRRDGAYECRFRLRAPAGDTHWMHAKARVMFEGGAPVRMIGVATDVTAEHQQQANGARQRDEFIATLAHELRNPLAPIRTGLQILQTVHNDQSVTDRTHAMIERQLGYLVHIVDDLVDVNRVAQGTLMLRRRRVSMHSIVESAIEMARKAIETARHDLRIHIECEPLFVDGDLTRLVQVVTNLLVNAAKFTADGGTIELKVQREGQSVCVRIADTGVGLAPDALERVFEMFTRERSEISHSGGLGVGLALARAVVRAHGGWISATSAGVGQGSTFSVWLPLMPTDVQEEVSSPPTPSIECGPKHRILIVDDNVDSAKSLETLLVATGHEVRSAFNGERALEIAEILRPEIALLDIGLPGMNGHEMARRLRSRTWCRDTVLVAMSGWGQEADKSRSAEVGIDHHWVKPIDLHRLQQLMAEAPTQD
jgi:signal transduction histidine kinase/ActR/RegA family two-component response regulator